MRDVETPVLKLLGAVVVGLVVTIGPIAAIADGLDDPPTASPAGVEGDVISQSQREQIRNLHEAYRAALAKLDWSAGSEGHSSDTLRQARELRMALRAEIFDVIHRGAERAPASGEGQCPYSGKAAPVRVKAAEGTLYL